MKYVRSRAAIAAGLCLAMAAGPAVPAFAAGAQAAQDAAEATANTEAEESIVYTSYYSNGAMIEQNGWNKSDFEAGKISYSQWAPTNIPTRDGYTFKGWSFSEGGDVVDLATIGRPAIDMSFYAVWEANEPAVEQWTYNFFDGAVLLSSSTWNSTDMIGTWVPADPVKDGYKFVGWCIEGTDYTIDLNAIPAPQGGANFYAKWEKVDAPAVEDVAYTFKDVDGTILGGVTYTYEQTLAGVYNWGVVTPEKPGYEFVGWCLEGTDCTIDPATVPGPQSNTTFVAKWNKVETPMQEPVTYTFVDEDGTTVLGSVTYDYAQVLAGLFNWAAIEPVKEGYEFAGWCVEGTDYVIDPAVVAAPQHDQTFVAKWNKVETPVHEDVTYTFVDEDGTTVLGSVTYTYEQALAGIYNWDVVTPADKPGYEFAGWCVEGTDYVIDPAITVAPQHDQTFVAKWNKVEAPVQEPVTYTFVDEDGTTVLGSVSYAYEQVLEGVFNWDVIEPVKEGYEFAGWCVEGTDYVIDPAFVAGPQHDQTFVAKWNKVETPVHEDVTYTFVEEDWTVLGSVTYTYEQALEGVFNWDVITPSKEGYKFLGWCYEGTDYVIDPATVAGPQHNATFVAKWEKIGDPVEQNVTFTFYDEDQTTVLGDVTYTMSQIENGVYNWNAVTPAPRDGYVFLGWSYMGSDAIIDFDVTRAPNTNQSLVAHWKAADPQTVTHKVTFSDGLEATEDAVVEVEDGKTVARPGDPVFEGYKFLGWTLDKETMELFDFATPVTADMTLYGVWQKVAAAEPGADEGANGNAGVENGKTEGQSAAQGETAKADEAKVTDLPQTSDSGMMVAGVAAAAGVAALGAGAFALRRRNAQR